MGNNVSVPIVITVKDEGVMTIVGSLPRVVSEDSLADFVHTIFAVNDAYRSCNGIREMSGTFYFPV